MEKRGSGNTALVFLCRPDDQAIEIYWGRLGGNKEKGKTFNAPSLEKPCLGVHSLLLAASISPSMHQEARQRGE